MHMPRSVPNAGDVNVARSRRGDEQRQKVWRGACGTESHFICFAGLLVVAIATRYRRD